MEIMSVLEQVRQLTGDKSITNSDKLYTIKLCDYHYTIIYETRSDYLYIADVSNGKVTNVATYEYLNTLDCL